MILTPMRVSEQTQFVYIIFFPTRHHPVPLTRLVDRHAFPRIKEMVPFFSPQHYM